MSQSNRRFVTKFEQVIMSRVMSLPAEPERTGGIRPLLMGAALVGAVAAATWFGWQAQDGLRQVAAPGRLPAAAPQQPAPAAAVPAPVAAQAAAPAREVAPHPAAAPAPIRPSFDIVRVNSRGEAVIAGRAAPQARLVLRDGPRELGRLTADRRGEWVFVPDAPLPAGARELKVVALQDDGTETEGEAPVVVVVPERVPLVAGRTAPPPDPQAVPLVLLVPTEGASRVLQAPPPLDLPATESEPPSAVASAPAQPAAVQPAPVQPAIVQPAAVQPAPVAHGPVALPPVTSAPVPPAAIAAVPAAPAPVAPGTRAPSPAPDAAPAPLPAAPGAAPAQPGRLQIETVDYDDRGEIRFAGTAPAGAPIRVYVDNRPAGTTTADPTGRWTLVPEATLPLGTHNLRVDQMAASGGVARRIEVPFQRVAVNPAQVAPGSVVVQPGQNLWRIARATYGQGLRYTVIYRANREQIRDPNRIYPGQVFALPEARASN